MAPIDGSDAELGFTKEKSENEEENGWASMVIRLNDFGPTGEK
jgi:hypothetical protein